MQPDLPRRPPARMVPIHPVPEYLADAELARLYEATKRAFQVPWMGVVAMAHAHYRGFYGCLWAGLEPIATSQRFQDICRDLRQRTEARVDVLGLAPLSAELERRGYAPRELEEIRETIEVFSHGNYPYLLMATVSRHLLAGGDLTGAGPLPRAASAAPVRRRPILMEAHHATAETRTLYSRIKRSLGLPFVNTDYRALARWPSYFALAWEGLEAVLRGDAHAAAAAELHEAALAAVRALPNPASLDAETLIAAADADGDRGEVTAMVELFQWLLPELCVNVACFRRQVA